jgi:hypothetical protein
MSRDDGSRDELMMEEVMSEEGDETPLTEYLVPMESPGSFESSASTETVRPAAANINTGNFLFGQDNADIQLFSCTVCSSDNAAQSVAAETTECAVDDATSFSCRVCAVFRVRTCFASTCARLGIEKRSPVDYLGGDILCSSFVTKESSTHAIGKAGVIFSRRTRLQL